MEASDRAVDKEKFPKLLEEMEWVNNDSIALEDRKFFTSFEIMKRKFFQNPFVPIGCLATCGVLGMGLANVVKGGPQRRSQLFMRWRVGLQAATVTSIFLGIIYENSFKTKE